ncbi:DUF2244 domain-containing protein [Novosphingobium pokkalii]|uniref:DUF2244 domain-containing protein n=1 Tax=Novosphingobium pokkalii TaxID=1770194 RepID=UPI00362CB592
MYEIVSPRADPTRHGSAADLILRMQENRSHLPPGARGAVAALALLLMAAAILPAFRGLLFVPVCALSAMAVLTFALDRHARSTPASEHLELADGFVSHRDRNGRESRMAAAGAQLDIAGCNDETIRLILRSRNTAIEIGRCLGWQERREVALVLNAALTQAGACTDLPTAVSRSAWA